MSSSDMTVERLDALAKEYGNKFGKPDGRLLAVVAPGRTELAGNHTDHEGGQVIAGAVNRYVRGVFHPNESGLIRVMSLGYGLVEVDCSDFQPHADERNTSAAIVRGLLSAFREMGFGGNQLGFDAVVTSEVPAGSGLSSSAAFELEIAQAMNWLWADGGMSAMRLAQMSQFAEREYFGKPCGLMDQAAVAVGGIAHMDFADDTAPKVERLDFDFAENGFAVCLVSVGADHSANTADYAAVPREMQDVARVFGHKRLREVRESDVIGSLPSLRAKLGDRAVLRALHYFREERFVQNRADALRAGDMAAFLELTQRSGASSAMYLQNVSIGGSPEQPAMVALAVAEELLGGRGAARIHGGGFGGTIQAFVRLDEADEFCRAMDEALGGKVSARYDIDQEGARAQWLES
ncbi:MAG: galactokinase family protein [Parafannyhessea umbonata]|nr:galactokinase family protein [Parafannyhessea umbonata]